MHLWMMICRLPFLDHYDFDLWPSFLEYSCPLGLESSTQPLSHCAPSFEVGIPYLVCGFILGWQNRASHFGLPLPCIDIWPHFYVFRVCSIFSILQITFLRCTLLTIKYISTVQYLSISFLYIHNLRLSHFSQLKRCSRATLSCDSSC